MAINSSNISIELAHRLTDVTAKVPRPGSANTDSTIMVPPRRVANFMPTMVTMGRHAFRSACRTMTRFSDAPLARAILI